MSGRTGKEREDRGGEYHQDKGAPARLKSNPFKIGLEKLDNGNEAREGAGKGKFRDIWLTLNGPI